MRKLFLVIIRSFNFLLFSWNSYIFGSNQVGRELHFEIIHDNIALKTPRFPLASNTGCWRDSLIWQHWTSQWIAESRYALALRSSSAAFSFGYCSAVATARTLGKFGTRQWYSAFRNKKTPKDHLPPRKALLTQIDSYSKLKLQTNSWPTFASFAASRNLFKNPNCTSNWW